MMYLVCVTVLFCQPIGSQELPKLRQKKSKPRLASKQALERLNVLVGDWRGIGQPKRGSRQGAWSEKTNCAWDFGQKKGPALKLVPKGGKQFTSLRLEFDEKRQLYVMHLDLGPKPDGKPIVLLAKPSDKKLVFLQSVEKAGERHRATLNVLSAKRVTLLLEKGKKSFRRVYGIGYTRAGTSIAVRGSGQPVCVVTGGTGSIRVRYKGRDYYVCCSGCQQAFNDDPEGVLADFAERMKREKAKKAASKVPGSGSPGK